MPVMSAERVSIADLALDHAVGLTEGAQRERAERLLLTDADFAAEVAFWSERMGALDATAPEYAPATLNWDTLERALNTTPARIPAPARMGLWEQLTFWRTAALAGGLASVLLAAGLSWQVSQPPAQPIYVAVLETPEGRPAAVVNAFADGTVSLVPIESITVPQGRILEVWTLQSREQGPISVGRIDQARRLKLDLAKLKAPSVGHLFEITVEPTGGSPTGRPTGPVLMKGLASTAL
jgi:anti-sigma-K factor RskA